MERPRLARVAPAGDIDSDSDDEETRRLEYLRRHRALLEQKRRLETERRVSELEADKASIAKRQEKVKAANELRGKDAANAKRKLGVAASLPSLRSPKPDDGAMLGMYAKPDEMDLDVLRVIAEKQALRDMAPFNTRGKYHARYMKDAYPIAGSQFRLEKERDLILSAKKRVLLANTVSLASDTVDATRRQSGGSARPFGQLAYRKLDFCVNQFSTVLQNEQDHVEIAEEQRRIRLLSVQHQVGLDQFWKLMHDERYHEALSWLRTHRFRDVNIPIVVRDFTGVVNDLVMEVNKEVGETPLMRACRLHHVELVRALLDQGAVVYLTTANGDTALHFLFQKWHDQQLTTLRLAAETFVKAEHTVRILEMLISQPGIDVNAQNAFGETAIQHAARLGLVHCVELLLANGADVFAQDRSGASSLSHARSNGHDDIVRLLETYEIVERVKLKERTQKQCENKLKQKRGTLTADWSESPEKLLARLAVEDRRAGHLRNQFVDRRGNVIVCLDDAED